MSGRKPSDPDGGYTGAELLCTGKCLAFPHKEALWPRDEGSQPETINATQCNQAFFGAKVLHPYCCHSAFSFPPASSWAHFQLPGRFFFHWWRGAGGGCVSVCTCGWKYSIWLVTLFLFLWTLMISTHILRSGHLVSKSNKSLFLGCFHCLCNERVVTCSRCFFCLRKKPWNSLCAFF